MKNKVEQLKKEIINSNRKNHYDYIILKLLNNGTINELTNRITDTKVKLKITSLIEKNYLTGNEQFLTLLSNFIYKFKEDFYFLNNNIDCIIEILLQNKKYTKYLLCKKYIGDNKNLPYFSYHTKRLIIYGYYNNIKKLAKKSNLIKKYAKDNKINLRKNIIDSENGLINLYQSLLKLSVCNAKALNNTLLFEDINHYIEQATQKYKSNKAKDSIYKYYIKEWEEMINNYYIKMNATEILLK